MLASDPLTAAQGLLGAKLHYQGCEGIVLESEAYFHLGDPACNSFSRATAGNFLEQYPGGTAYVYLNYGIH